MNSKIFKLSTLTVFILATTQANAALYRIVEVSSEGEEAYASVIETAVVSDDLGCFNATGCEDNDYQLAGDTKESFDGFSYKQEVPFGIDNRFYYQDLDDLESYCYRELGYSTCDSWAFNQWAGNKTIGGLYREREAWNLGTYQANAAAFSEAGAISSPDSPFLPSGSSFINNSKDVVINSMDGSTPIGNTSSGYFAIGNNAALVYRSRGYYGSALLLPKQQSEGADAIVEQMGRTMAFDSFEYNGKTYVVGSGSVAPFAYKDSDKDYLGDVGNCVKYAEPATKKECQNFAFATKPYVWDTSALDSNGNITGVSASLWRGIGNSLGNDTYTTANKGDFSAQASVRAAIVPSGANQSTNYDGLPVLVGYNTDEQDSRLLMQAAVFYPKSGFNTVTENGWNYTFIADATVKSSGDYIYSNSVAKDINNNLLVVGESKRFGDKPEAGAANQRLFIADASNGNPRANYFSGGIFFSGAGGEVNAINNYNEVVGQIDADSNREINGKQRRRRAFIYPYNGTGTESIRRSIFNNQAWWLDDLTNGGTYSTINNHYRIINANDINDAGVIAATALKCSAGEYDSTAHNAYCGGGTAKEEIVAVKLIPIANATSSDIQTRAAENETVSRKGAGVGLFSLVLLSLLGLRRKIGFSRNSALYN